MTNAAEKYGKLPESLSTAALDQTLKSGQKLQQNDVKQAADLDAPRADLTPGKKSQDDETKQRGITPAKKVQDDKPKQRGLTQ